ncbi:MAG: type II toxin-antitoxin system RelE/ParE family toxin [Pseudomonadales bacterium]|nr:type II toxin-antitoxin system RelE/ParE family toxin [Pseudomonadales bacterium]MCP5329582.1 type II toxin-antitoxin system RelE/ParE family toxin [Pseudomonadales bacterium]MCP5343879.1 type II toxin-antitoxin system RelE/ParE family toxin [Pseudomonadales bacterium]
MLEVRTTTAFAKWFERLKDNKARARIQARIDRLLLGHFGDAESVGEGVKELRIFYGPGYRIYFVQKGAFVIVLLIGGDKSSQRLDIARAKSLARQLEA